MEKARMGSLEIKILFVTILIFVPLERVFALHREQKTLRRDWANDAIFLFLNRLLSKFGLLVLLAPALFAATYIVPSGYQAWVGNLPYWVQIPLIFLLADLGCYWIHRMFHAVPWLWRFHAVHHSIEELDWLAAFRVHPVDQILTKGASLVPVFALGFSEWAIGLYVLLTHFQSVFVHSNLRLRFGPLRYLIASPEFHHWHHSTDSQARDRNFAGQLPILDAAFGTLHMPAGCRPATYGLDKPMPQRYALQLLYPFVGDRAFQSAPAELAGKIRGGHEPAARVYKPESVVSTELLS